MSAYLDEKTVFCFYKFRFIEQLKFAENRIYACDGNGRRVGFRDGEFLTE